MTLQWTFIATFLYTEIFIVVLLLLPFISPSRWHKIFKSRLLKNIESYSTIYFNVLIVVLLILFADAIRDVRNYSGIEPETDARAEALVHMKLFRAQRNFYIAGFALFLWLVLKRLVLLISHNANLKAQSEASLRQAQSATDTAKQLMEDKENNENKAREDRKVSGLTTVVDAAVAVNEPKKQLDHALLELEKTKEELYHARLDLISIKKQAESTGKEYDRLAEEHSQLTKKLAILGGEEEGSKKDD